MWKSSSPLVICAIVSLHASAAGVGNRLTYLDEFCDPYYPGLEMPKLITPQWVGEEGVEAVIVLAIDDLVDTRRYEEFLRPILNRLKQIDGRAALSIMTKQVDPDDPQLQQWLKEGVVFGAHTRDHPCPCLQGGDLATAKQTFDTCVDLLGGIANNRTVAYRMPCCDSMNSVSPRFFTEIFNKTTPAGRFLTIDSSVFQVFTADDPQLPRALVLDADGGEKFRKYVPTDCGMVNLVENYPYPYVIGRLVWEFPCLMPSDWDAQNHNGKCSPATVRDLKAAVDATVIKQGVFSLCFHPHGWIAAEQVIELIDHAVARHGRKIKFLTFREVQERIDQNLLGGQPLRASDGRDNGVRLLDLDNDGCLDVVIGNEHSRQTRLWLADESRWRIGDFPTTIVEGGRQRCGVRFAVLRPDGAASVLSVLGRDEDDRASRGTHGTWVPPQGWSWHFDGTTWVIDREGAAGLTINVPGRSVDGGIRARDLDGDGVCELIVGNSVQQAVFGWSRDRRRWTLLPFTLPEGTAIVDAQGRDAGLRFVDVDNDGFPDVIFSDTQRFSAHLFTSMAEGWSRAVLTGRRPSQQQLPMIVRGDGTNNGAWFKYGHMWVQNEETGKKLPDQVDRRSFKDDLLSPSPPK